MDRSKIRSSFGEAMFVGRRTELDLLTKQLDHVKRTGGGRSVAIRGRRQVGKSRLVQELCDQVELPYCFYTAVKGASSVEAVGHFLGALRDSSLLTSGGRDLLPSQPTAGGWGDMLRVLAGVLPDTPSVVVFDELPWISEQDATFDGHLQVAWDRLLSSKPVLLLLLGSDLHMMQRFTEYDRPFYGRATNMVLGPFNLGETAAVTGLSGADAIDAHLITGGLPGVALEWAPGTPPADFLRQEISNKTSALFTVPEQSLASEFPAPDTARRILEAVGGAGGRTFSNIAAAAGDRGGPVSSGTLSPLLHRLVEEKQILTVDKPLSTKPSKLAQYRIADSNLRLYLAILRDVHQLVLRDRTAAARAVLDSRWSTWRGNAVEPIIRDALAISAGAGRLPWADTWEVGAWWNRQFNPEIDLVGVDRTPVASRIAFAGSIKWQEGPFDRRHLDELRRDAPLIPGFQLGVSGLVVVSRSGVDLPADSVDLVWGPDDIVQTWSA
ncbi:ATP-binding protein [Micromonospora profundi]|uniref:ATP-binding protein n=1 Tax=Micromonospora profundi TaxID=1420889 RepID=A0AAJ6HVI2_9ACTN|nr:ATP-binding protein [Micromonospora profundi]WLS47511.1 ATP-binding protein [Micromonospora profundi]